MFDCFRWAFIFVACICSVLASCWRRPFHQQRIASSIWVLDDDSLEGFFDLVVAPFSPISHRVGGQSGLLIIQVTEYLQPLLGQGGALAAAAGSQRELIRLLPPDDHRNS